MAAETRVSPLPPSRKLTNHSTIKCMSIFLCISWDNIRNEKGVLHKRCFLCPEKIKLLLPWWVDYNIWWSGTWLTPVVTHSLGGWEGGWKERREKRRGGGRCRRRSRCRRSRPTGGTAVSMWPVAQKHLWNMLKSFVKKLSKHLWNSDQTTLEIWSMVAQSEKLIFF